MKPKLELKRVSYSYHSMEGETPALSDISFTADAGSYIAIVGPSGCGKSTLLSLLSGLARPDNGSILIDGKPLEQAKDAIGYMLQKDHLFEWRSILSNVALGLEIRRQMDAENRAQLLQMLKTYGLEDFQDKRPSQLSGGMRQRAALIRTLALKPDLLLLDEPFSALDYQTRLSVCDDISSIIRKTKKTAILVTHDLSEAISVADRIVILSSRPARIKKILDLSFSPPPEQQEADAARHEEAEWDTGTWRQQNAEQDTGTWRQQNAEQDTGTWKQQNAEQDTGTWRQQNAEQDTGTWRQQNAEQDTDASKQEHTDRPMHPAASLPEHGMSSMERRNAPEFSYYFNLLWKELSSDDASGPAN